MGQNEVVSPVRGAACWLKAYWDAFENGECRAQEAGTLSTTVPMFLAGGANLASPPAGDSPQERSAKLALGYTQE